MVVAQLVKQLLTTPEDRSSNPVIGEVLKNNHYQLYWKDEIKEKRCHEWPIFKNIEGKWRVSKNLNKLTFERFRFLNRK